MNWSFDRGGFGRVIIGLLATLFFIISAITDPSDRRNALFFAGLSFILTWQQYSLYRMQQNDHEEDSD